MPESGQNLTSVPWEREREMCSMGSVHTIIRDGERYCSAANENSTIAFPPPPVYLSLSCFLALLANSLFQHHIQRRYKKRHLFSL